MKGRPQAASGTETKAQAPARPAPAILSVADLEVHGTLLGKGSNGSAYLVGDRVFKIYDLMLPPEVVRWIVEYWNITYTKIHDGKFIKFANAHYLTLKDKDFPSLDCPVMEMPYIKGTPPPACNFCWINDCVFTCCPRLFSCLCCAPGLKKANKALLKIHFDMEDYFVKGNIVMHEGFALVVDYDFVLPVPVKVTEEACVFDAPLSPRAREKWQKKYPKKSFTDREKKSEAKAASGTPLKALSLESPTVGSSTFVLFSPTPVAPLLSPTPATSPATSLPSPTPAAPPPQGGAGRSSPS